jgi:hypothetical protein
LEALELKGMKFEEFSAKLGKFSIQQLYTLARSYDIKLPKGLEPQAVVIEAIYAAFQTSSGPSAAVDKSAPSSDDPAAEGPQFTACCVTGQKTYHRCNTKFTNSWQSYALAKFTPTELRTLRNDKGLRTKGIPEDV